MANTTLETYVQNFLSCMDCHQSAPIASAPAAAAVRPSRKLVTLRPRNQPAAVTTASSPYASDYSFMFVTETNH